MSKRTILNSFSLFLGLLLILLPTSSYAALPDITAFRSFKDVTDLNIPVTSVVELPLDDVIVERYEFAIQDITANRRFVPYYFNNQFDAISLTATTEPSTASPRNLVDQKPLTYTEFILTDDAPNQTQIHLRSTTPVQASALTISLANNVALPTHIAITANTASGQRVVVAKKRLYSTTVHFPTTTAKEWQVTLTYSQPLRITELSLQQDTATKTNSRSLRWLAEPNHKYRVYLDPDRQISPTPGELGDLSQDQDVVTLTAVPSVPNSQYVIADTDQDTIPNITDNCVTVPNQDQTDRNQNGRGDVCDDFDRDGILNHEDNCPDQPNIGQTDTDGDNIGDACDTEESRLTEKYPWVPWMGIGFATIVLVVLFAFTAYSMKQRQPDQPDENSDKTQPPSSDNPSNTDETISPDQPN